LHLEDSFHTEGFYRRAESLYRQLTPAELLERTIEKKTAAPTEAAGGSDLVAAACSRSVPSPERVPRPAALKPGSPSTQPKRESPQDAFAATSRAPKAKSNPRAPKRREEIQPLLPFMS
jgi:hypothetical protein